MEWKKVVLNKKTSYILLTLFLFLLVSFVYGAKDYVKIAEEKKEILQEFHALYGKEEMKNANIVLQWLYQYESREENIDIEKNNVALVSLREQVEYISGYTNKIEGIMKQADQMNTISIFAKQDSFSEKNLQKTKQDFTEIKEVIPQFSIFDFLIYFLNNKLLHGIVTIAGIVVVFALVEENKEGLKKMIFSTRKGRGRLFLNKVGALFFMDTIIIFLFYGSMLLVSCGLFGENLGDIWNLPVQSISEFGMFTYHIKIGTFLLSYMIYHILVLFLITLLSWVIILLFPGILYGVSAIGGCGIYFYLCNSLIESNSSVQALKYCNLWYLQSGSGFFSEYKNVNVFSNPVNKNTLILYVSGCLLISLFVIGLWVSVKHYPEVKKIRIPFRKVRNILKQGICKLERSFGLQMAEFYKVCIVQKGLFIIIGMLLIFYCQNDFTNIHKSEQQDRYYNFMEQYGGTVTEDAKEYIKNLKEEVDIVYKEYEKASSLYEKERISMEEWIAYSQRVTSYEQERLFLEQIQEQSRYLETLKERDIEGWYVNTESYNHLIKEGSEIENLILFLGIVLLCSGIFSYEEKSGAIAILQTTIKGRTVLFQKKRNVVVGLCTIIFCGMTFLKFLCVYKVYGIEQLFAPVQSIPDFSFVTIHINILSFLILLYGLKFLFMMVVAVFTCMLSTMLTQKQTIVSAMIFCMPVLLQLAGLEWAKYLSVIKIFSVNLLLLEIKNLALLLCIAAIFLLFGICCARYTKLKWCREIRGEVHEN